MKDDNRTPDCYMALAADLVDVDKTKGIIEHSISVELDEDRDGDVLRVEGVDLKWYRQNPVVLYMHGRDPRWGTAPIGANKRILVGERKGKPSLEVSTKLAIELASPLTEFIRMVFEMYARRYLRAWSVGFRDQESEERKTSFGWKALDFIRWELLEYSGVPIPANPAALTDAVKDGVADIKTLVKHGFIRSPAGMEQDQVDEYLSELLVIDKTVVPFRESPTMPKDSAWDAGAARSRLAKWASSDGSGNKDTVNWTKFRAGFTWVDAARKDQFTGYSMPHHDISGGAFKVNFRACAACLVVLRGGRGGVSIPVADRAKCERHIAGHYKQFGVEFPERGLNADTLEVLTPELALELEDQELVRSALSEMTGQRDTLRARLMRAERRLGAQTLDKPEPAGHNAENKPEDTADRGSDETPGHEPGGGFAQALADRQAEHELDD